MSKDSPHYAFYICLFLLYSARDQNFSVSSLAYNNRRNDYETDAVKKKKIFLCKKNKIFFFSITYLSINYFCVRKINREKSIYLIYWIWYFSVIIIQWKKQLILGKKKKDVICFFFFDNFFFNRYFTEFSSYFSFYYVTRYTSITRARFAIVKVHWATQLCNQVIIMRRVQSKYSWDPVTSLTDNSGSIL